MLRSDIPEHIGSQSGYLFNLQLGNVKIWATIDARASSLVYFSEEMNGKHQILLDVTGACIGKTFFGGQRCIHILKESSQWFLRPDGSDLEFDRWYVALEAAADVIDAPVVKSDDGSESRRTIENLNSSSSFTIDDISNGTFEALIPPSLNCINNIRIVANSTRMILIGQDPDLDANYQRSKVSPFSASTMKSGFPCGNYSTTSGEAPQPLRSYYQILEFDRTKLNPASLSDICFEHSYLYDSAEVQQIIHSILPQTAPESSNIMNDPRNRSNSVSSGISHASSLNSYSNPHSVGMRVQSPFDSQASSLPPEEKRSREGTLMTIPEVDGSLQVGDSLIDTVASELGNEKYTVNEGETSSSVPEQSRSRNVSVSSNTSTVISSVSQPPMSIMMNPSSSSTPVLTGLKKKGGAYQGKAGSSNPNNLNLTVSALLGAVRFLYGYQLLVVTKASSTASIGSHKVYSPEGHTLIPVFVSQREKQGILSRLHGTIRSIGSGDSESDAEARYQSLFLSMDLSKDFYFSKTYDLSRTLQSQVVLAPTITPTYRSSPNWNGISYVQNEVTVNEQPSHHVCKNDGIDEEHTDKTSLQSTPPPLNGPIFPCREEFVWNHFLLSELFGRDVFVVNPNNNIQSVSYLTPEDFRGSSRYENGFQQNVRRGVSLCWGTPIVHGFLKQDIIQLNATDQAFLTLVARRSRHFAGTRYLKRGISSDGHVANFVETEQILATSSTSFSSSSSHQSHDATAVTSGKFPRKEKISSFVQVRGSIPKPWIQKTLISVPKPPILLHPRDFELSSTKAHFHNMTKSYGAPLLLLNLVKKKESHPREVIVGAEYAKTVYALNRDLPEQMRLQYLALDYSGASKVNMSIIDILRDTAKWALANVSIFAHNGGIRSCNQSIIPFGGKSPGSAASKSPFDPLAVVRFFNLRGREQLDLTMISTFIRRKVSEMSLKSCFKTVPLLPQHVKPLIYRLNSRYLKAADFKVGSVVRLPKSVNINSELLSYRQSPLPPQIAQNVISMLISVSSRGYSTLNRMTFLDVPEFLGFSGVSAYAKRLQALRRGDLSAELDEKSVERGAFPTLADLLRRIPFPYRAATRDMLLKYLSPYRIASTKSSGNGDAPVLSSFSHLSASALNELRELFPTHVQDALAREESTLASIFDGVSASSSSIEDRLADQEAIDATINVHPYLYRLLPNIFADYSQLSNSVNLPSSLLSSSGLLSTVDNESVVGSSSFAFSFIPINATHGSTSSASNSLSPLSFDKNRSMNLSNIGHGIVAGMGVGISSSLLPPAAFSLNSLGSTNTSSMNSSIFSEYGPSRRSNWISSIPASSNHGHATAVSNSLESFHTGINGSGRGQSFSNFSNTARSFNFTVGTSSGGSTSQQGMVDVPPLVEFFIPPPANVTIPSQILNTMHQSRQHGDSSVRNQLEGLNNTLDNVGTVRERRKNVYLSPGLHGQFPTLSLDSVTSTVDRHVPRDPRLPYVSYVSQLSSFASTRQAMVAGSAELHTGLLSSLESLVLETVDSGNAPSQQEKATSSWRDELLTTHEAPAAWEAPRSIRDGFRSCMGVAEASSLRGLQEFPDESSTATKSPLHSKAENADRVRALLLTAGPLTLPPAPPALLTLPVPVPASAAPFHALEGLKAAISRGLGAAAAASRPYDFSELTGSESFAEKDRSRPAPSINLRHLRSLGAPSMQTSNGTVLPFDLSSEDSNKPPFYDLGSTAIEQVLLMAPLDFYGSKSLGSFGGNSRKGLDPGSDKDGLQGRPYTSTQSSRGLGSAANEGDSELERALKAKFHVRSTHPDTVPSFSIQATSDFIDTLRVLASSAPQSEDIFALRRNNSKRSTSGSKSLDAISLRSSSERSSLSPLPPPISPKDSEESTADDENENFKSAQEDTYNAEGEDRNYVISSFSPSSSFRSAQNSSASHPKESKNASLLVEMVDLHSALHESDDDNFQQSISSSMPGLTPELKSTLKSKSAEVVLTAEELQHLLMDHSTENGQNDTYTPLSQLIPSLPWYSNQSNLSAMPLAVATSGLPVDNASSSMGHPISGHGAPFDSNPGSHSGTNLMLETLSLPHPPTRPVYLPSLPPLKAQKRRINLAFRKKIQFILGGSAELPANKNLQNRNVGKEVQALLRIVTALSLQKRKVPRGSSHNANSNQSLGGSTSIVGATAVANANSCAGDAAILMLLLGRSPLLHLPSSIWTSAGGTSGGLLFTDSHSRSVSDGTQSILADPAVPHALSASSSEVRKKHKSPSTIHPPDHSFNPRMLSDPTLILLGLLGQLWRGELPPWASSYLEGLLCQLFPSSMPLSSSKSSLNVFRKGSSSAASLSLLEHIKFVLAGREDPFAAACTIPGFLFSSHLESAPSSFPHTVGARNALRRSLRGSQTAAKLAGVRSETICASSEQDYVRPQSGSLNRHTNMVGNAAVELEEGRAAAHTDRRGQAGFGDSGSRHFDDKLDEISMKSTQGNHGQQVATDLLANALNPGHDFLTATHAQTMQQSQSHRSSRQWSLIHSVHSGSHVPRHKPTASVFPVGPIRFWGGSGSQSGGIPPDRGVSGSNHVRNRMSDTNNRDGSAFRMRKYIEIGAPSEYTYIDLRGLRVTGKVVKNTLRKSVPISKNEGYELNQLYEEYDFCRNDALAAFASDTEDYWGVGRHMSVVSESGNQTSAANTVILSTSGKQIFDTPSVGDSVSLRAEADAYAAGNVGGGLDKLLSRALVRSLGSSKFGQPAASEPTSSMKTIEDVVEGTVSFLSPPAPEVDSLVSVQRGVVRTNCIDCLDRTNVAQVCIGVAALGMQARAIGLFSPLSGQSLGPGHAAGGSAGVGISGQNAAVSGGSITPVQSNSDAPTASLAPHLSSREASFTPSPSFSSSSFTSANAAAAAVEEDDNALQAGLPAHHPLVNSLTRLFELHGDAIAMQYGGSEANKKVTTASNADGVIVPQQMDQARNNTFLGTSTASTGASTGGGASPGPTTSDAGSKGAEDMRQNRVHFKDIEKDTGKEKEKNLFSALWKPFSYLSVDSLPLVGQSSVSSPPPSSNSPHSSSLNQLGSSSSKSKSVTPGGSGIMLQSSGASEILTSLKRYYSNSFTDSIKQASITLFLGAFVPRHHAAISGALVNIVVDSLERAEKDALSKSMNLISESIQASGTADSALASIDSSLPLEWRRRVVLEMIVDTLSSLPLVASPGIDALRSTLSVAGTANVNSTYNLNTPLAPSIGESKGFVYSALSALQGIAGSMNAGAMAMQRARGVPGGAMISQLIPFSQAHHLWELDTDLYLFSPPDPFQSVGNPVNQKMFILGAYLQRLFSRSGNPAIDGPKALVVPLGAGVSPGGLLIDTRSCRLLRLPGDSPFLVANVIEKYLTKRANFVRKYDSVHGQLLLNQIKADRPFFSHLLNAPKYSVHSDSKNRRLSASAANVSETSLLSASTHLDENPWVSALLHFEQHGLPRVLDAIVVKVPKGKIIEGYEVVCDSSGVVDLVDERELKEKKKSDKVHALVSRRVGRVLKNSADSSLFTIDALNSSNHLTSFDQLLSGVISVSSNSGMDGYPLTQSVPPNASKSASGAINANTLSNSQGFGSGYSYNFSYSQGVGSTVILVPQFGPNSSQFLFDRSEIDRVISKHNNDNVMDSLEGKRNDDAVESSPSINLKELDMDHPSARRESNSSIETTRFNPSPSPTGSESKSLNVASVERRTSSSDSEAPSSARPSMKSPEERRLLRQKFFTPLKFGDESVNIGKDDENAQESNSVWRDIIASDPVQSRSSISSSMDESSRISMSETSEIVMFAKYNDSLNVRPSKDGFSSLPPPLPVPLSESSIFSQSLLADSLFGDIAGEIGYSTVANGYPKDLLNIEGMITCISMTGGDASDVNREDRVKKTSDLAFTDRTSSIVTSSHNNSFSSPSSPLLVTSQSLRRSSSGSPQELLQYYDIYDGGRGLSNSAESSSDAVSQLLTSLNDPIMHQSAVQTGATPSADVVSVQSPRSNSGSSCGSGSMLPSSAVKYVSQQRLRQEALERRWVYGSSEASPNAANWMGITDVAASSSLLSHSWLSLSSNTSTTGFASVSRSRGAQEGGGAVGDPLPSASGKVHTSAPLEPVLNDLNSFSSLSSVSAKNKLLYHQYCSFVAPSMPLMVSGTEGGSVSWSRNIDTSEVSLLRSQLPLPISERHFPMLSAPPSMAHLFEAPPPVDHHTFFKASIDKMKSLGRSSYDIDIQKFYRNASPPVDPDIQSRSQYRDANDQSDIKNSYTSPFACSSQTNTSNIESSSSVLNTIAKNTLILTSNEEIEVYRRYTIFPFGALAHAHAQANADFVAARALGIVEPSLSMADTFLFSSFSAKISDLFSSTSGGNTTDTNQSGPLNWMEEKSLSLRTRRLLFERARAQGALSPLPSILSKKKLSSVNPPPLSATSSSSLPVPGKHLPRYNSQLSFVSNLVSTASKHRLGSGSNDNTTLTYVPLEVYREMGLSQHILQSLQIPSLSDSVKIEENPDLHPLSKPNLSSVIASGPFLGLPRSLPAQEELQQRLETLHPSSVRAAHYMASIRADPLSASFHLRSLDVRVTDITHLNAARKKDADKKYPIEMKKKQVVYQSDIERSVPLSFFSLLRSHNGPKNAVVFPEFESSEDITRTLIAAGATPLLTIPIFIRLFIVGSV